jgi:hypothetical protein
MLGAFKPAATRRSTWAEPTTGDVTVIAGVRWRMTGVGPDGKPRWEQVAWRVPTVPDTAWPHAPDLHDRGDPPDIDALLEEEHAGLKARRDQLLDRAHIDAGAGRSRRTRRSREDIARLKTKMREIDAARTLTGGGKRRTKKTALPKRFIANRKSRRPKATRKRRCRCRKR